MTLKEYTEQFSTAIPDTERTKELQRLADGCHVHIVTIYRWISGAVEPAPLYKEKIAELTGRTVEELFPGMRDSNK